MTHQEALRKEEIKEKQDVTATLTLPPIPTETELAAISPSSEGQELAA